MNIACDFKFFTPLFNNLISYTDSIVYWLGYCVLLFSLFSSYSGYGQSTDASAYGQQQSAYGQPVSIVESEVSSMQVFFVKQVQYNQL